VYVLCQYRLGTAESRPECPVLVRCLYLYLHLHLHLYLHLYMSKHFAEMSSAEGV